MDSEVAVTICGGSAAGVELRGANIALATAFMDGMPLVSGVTADNKRSCRGGLLSESPDTDMPRICTRVWETGECRLGLETRAREKSKKVNEQNANASGVMLRWLGVVMFSQDWMSAQYDRLAEMVRAGLLAEMCWRMSVG